jgi:hypothetical protein
MSCRERDLVQLRPTRPRALLSPVAIILGLTLVVGGVTPASAVTGHTISGRVFLDSSSTPAGDGEVLVSFLSSSTIVEATTTTDTDGFFVSPLLTAAFVKVKYDYVGAGDYRSMFYSSYGDRLFYNGGGSISTAADRILSASTLPQMVTITGNVSLGALGDHPGGTASINWQRNYSYTNWEKSLEPDVVTSSDGSFSLRLGTGKYEFSVISNDADFQSRPFDLLYYRNISLTVTPSTTALPDVTLPPLGRATGRVLVGSAGVPASAGEYVVTTDPCPVTCSHTTTAADGTYELSSLYDYTYQILIYPSADGTVKTDNQVYTSAIIGESGRDVVVPDVTVAKRVTVRGHVNLDDSAHSAGLGRVKVVLQSFYRSYTAYTDEGGDFVINGVVQTGGVSAKFTDTLTDPVYAHQYFDDRAWLSQDITIGESDVTLNATMHKGAQISGRLTNSLGQPLSGFTVTARGFEPGYEAEVMRTTTAIDGTYVLYPLPPGDYRVTAAQTSGISVYSARQYGPDYLHPTLPGFARVEIGEVLGGIDITMLKPTSVTIRVRCIPCSTTGLVNGSEVYLLRQGDKRAPENWKAAAHVTTDGEYASFGPTIPGTYRLEVLVGGYFTSTTYYSGQFTVKDGDNAPIVVPFSSSQLIRDFNGDFTPDLLSRSYKSGLLMTAGKKSTIGTSKILIARPAAGSRYFSGGDIDWDGGQDIMEITASGVLYKHAGTSRGMSSKTVKISTGWSKYTWVAEAGDLDFDANDDYVAKDKYGVLWLIRNTKPNVFATPKKISSGWNTWTAIIAAGDLDVDGYADLVVRDTTGAIWFVAGEGGTAFASPVKTDANWPRYKSFAATGDFDGDGFGDIVATDRSGRVWLLPGDGTGGWLTARQIGKGWVGRTLVP